MARNQSASQPTTVGVLYRVAPGLASLLHYQRGDFPHDFIAGLSVAAVAVPVGVAYAQLVGFNPAIGLYSSILPLVAYAVFGTSRQLIVGPDAATCALVAAAITPLAAGNRELYQSLSVTVAFLAGLLCIAASLLKLGAVADFLSKPILVGFLNGIALSIVFGQLGKIFGFQIAAGGIIPRFYEFISKLGSTHWPTLAVGVGVFLVLQVTPYALRRVPAALVAMIIAAIAVKVFGLEGYGVKTVGEVPAGLPHLSIPHVPLEMLPDLVGDAAGLAVVTFSSMMLTSRGFASKNRYDVDADRDFAALGAANIASALSQGFAVSGADSRTAVSDSTGGRTQVTSLVAAIAVGIVLLFLTRPLRYVPIAALGAVLVKAALSLVDVEALRTLFGIDRREFGLSILSTIGVVAVGSIHAILVAVILALMRFIRLTSRPKLEILGEVKGYPGFHSLEQHREAATTPGVVLLRFNAPIVFFNALYFKREVLAAAAAAGPSLKRVLIDMLPVTLIDATGLLVIREVADRLREIGVEVAAAGRQTEWRLWASSRPGLPVEHRIPIYATLDAGIEAFRSTNKISGSTTEFADHE